MPSEDSEALNDALQSWFGTEISWRPVTLSVNQMIRQIQIEPDENSTTPPETSDVQTLSPIPDE